MPTILELAKKAGFTHRRRHHRRAQDATPAVLASHVVDRDCKGPADDGRRARPTPSENGGAGSIAEQTGRPRRRTCCSAAASQYFDQTVTAGPYAG